ncbi:MAG: (E)-4-hydroxy-3-methylbut-2-enyl-diphosphate synthase [Planctomycetes bacterium]|nr:(E)-4-hydroxy-3-methylbut-2-enyl-diphosphate synthase [Planctomycetota bacterium]
MNSSAKTRVMNVGRLQIGGGQPIAVQSMCATRTTDLEATRKQVEDLQAAGADVIRIAVDNERDVEALATIRQHTDAVLSVDLQENYRLAELVAPHVDKIRYNPGHLHHHETHKSVQEKVAWLVDVARQHDLAVRIGVNCGSVAPDYLERYPGHRIEAMVQSAVDHCRMIDDLGFTNYCVSLKDSHPERVIEGNVRFAELRPDVPLHLGVTEAGMPPDGVIKTRIAFEQLLSRGIGDTIRVSLTLPFDRKGDEITVGRAILEDIENGRFRSVPKNFGQGLNIISCPSCSRVENEAFIELAAEVKKQTAFAAEHQITIAVMGCRVNGPGETDEADLGLWCGPTRVNLKRKEESLGSYTYDEVLPRLLEELEHLIAKKQTT